MRRKPRQPRARAVAIQDDVLGTFLELSKLESKKIRLQVLRLVIALETEALGVFRIARRLERTLWTDPKELAHHGRLDIVEQLRSKFASEHVALAQVEILDERLDPLPGTWYRQGACSWTAPRL
jgi:hypothetical protein